MLKKENSLILRGILFFATTIGGKINIIFIPIALTNRAKDATINIPYGDTQKGAENGNRKE